MDIGKLIFNVAVLFVMMLPGVILKKCRMCPDGFGKGISNLVLYIAQPALVVYAYISASVTFADIWQNALWVLALSIVAHALFAVVAMNLFKKAPDARQRMLRFATIFSNAAFMGIPLVEAAIGAEAAIYASIYNITFNFFLWTLGVHLCTRIHGEDLDGDGDSDMRDAHLSARKHIKKANSFIKVLLHPVTLASAIGVLLLVFGINVPVMEGAGLKLVSDSLYMLKSLVAPLSMVVIGLRLVDVDFRGIFKDLHMYLFLALRHFLLPLAVLGICELLQLFLPSLTDSAELIIIIMAATPAATSSTMFAEMYDCDAAYVSRLVVVSTILCIATMPLVVMLV